MREALIPSELEEQIDSVRGDTPFDTWLALAIAEKTWGSRWVIPQYSTEITELWAAIVQYDGFESFLLWRQATGNGQAMMPVIVFEEAGVEMWAERFAMELNWMDGPPIAWKHFEGGEFVEWLRAPAVEGAS